MLANGRFLIVNLPGAKRGMRLFFSISIAGKSKAWLLYSTNFKNRPDRERCQGIVLPHSPVHLMTEKAAIRITVRWYTDFTARFLPAIF